MDEKNLQENNMNSSSEPDENFEILFKESSSLPGRLDPGQKVKSVVAGI